MITSLSVVGQNVVFTCSKCNEHKEFVLGSENDYKSNCNSCNTFVNIYKNDLIKYVNHFKDLQFLRFENVTFPETKWGYHLYLTSDNLKYVEINKCPTLFGLSVMSDNIHTISVKECVNLDGININDNTNPRIIRY